MCRDDPLARQAIQERSQRENSLWVKMRLGFLKQGEEVGLEWVRLFFVVSHPAAPDPRIDETSILCRP